MVHAGSTKGVLVAVGNLEVFKEGRNKMYSLTYRVIGYKIMFTLQIFSNSTRLEVASSSITFFGSLATIWCGNRFQVRTCLEDYTEENDREDSFLTNGGDKTTIHL